MMLIDNFIHLRETECVYTLHRVCNRSSTQVGRTTSREYSGYDWDRDAGLDTFGASQGWTDDFMRYDATLTTAVPAQKTARHPLHCMSPLSISRRGYRPGDNLHSANRYWKPRY